MSSNKVADDSTLTKKNVTEMKDLAGAKAQVVDTKPAAKKLTQKQKDAKAEKEQTKLLAKIVWEQKWYLLLMAPFMFLGAVGDFLFPDLIGKVVNAMREGDKDEIHRQLITWIVVIAIGAVGTMCNSVLSGVTAERIGNSLR